MLRFALPERGMPAFVIAIALFICGMTTLLLAFVLKNPGFPGASVALISSLLVSALPGVTL